MNKPRFSTAVRATLKTPLTTIQNKHPGPTRRKETHLSFAQAHCVARRRGPLLRAPLHSRAADRAGQGDRGGHRQKGPRPQPPGRHIGAKEIAQIVFACDTLRDTNHALKAAEDSDLSVVAASVAEVVSHLTDEALKHS